MKPAALLISFSLATASLTSVAAPSSYPYLFEQLKKPTYKSSFRSLFKNQKNIEPWVRGYIKSSNGVDTPGERRLIQGKPYELYKVCEPHNCGGNFLYVITEPKGIRAWALLTKEKEISRYFGNPPQDIKSELEAIAATAAQ